jgi:hypothetical protein
MKTRLNIITFFIGSIWFVNGLLCKVLNLVPRHQEIVASVLSDEHARELTLIIGVLEIGMAIWVWSKIFSRLSSVLQIVGILVMNIIEYFFTQDLLLWGKLNFVFAVLFISLIYYKEFVLKKID